MKILIAGTGKMGRDVGLFFLTKGQSVTWITRTRESAENQRTTIVKAIRRIETIASVAIPHENFSVETYDTLLGQFDLVIENVIENLHTKQAVFKNLKPVIDYNTILTSNSSSILPSRIAGGIIGLHFFYPVGMTKTVEVIFPMGVNQSKKEQLIYQLKIWDLDFLLQNENSAFAVNRLLLPLQTEVFKLLVSGVSAVEIEAASKAGIFPFGQLSFMDNVGLDVLLPAIQNYFDRATESEKEKYQNLINELNQLIKIGKLGRKNRNGLMSGDPLPWKVDPNKSNDGQELSDRCKQIFLNTCRNFLEQKQLTKTELNLVINNIFGVGKSWPELNKN